MTYIRLAIAAGVLAALIGAFFYGRSTGIEHQQAADAKVMARATVRMNKGVAAIDALNGRLADAQRDQSTEGRTIYETAIQYRDRPVYKSVCIDVDGGVLLDRAAANANREPAGEPAGATAAPTKDAAKG